MAYVRVEQRNAHLAGPVLLDHVNGRDGEMPKAVLTAISNTRRGAGESREEESTAIQWTLWGKQAENAAQYLGKGSHVNIVGRLRNSIFEKDGETVYGMTFTAEEIDYLDSRAQREARQGRQEFVAEMEASETAMRSVSDASHRTRQPRATRGPAHAAA